MTKFEEKFWQYSIGAPALVGGALLFLPISPYAWPLIGASFALSFAYIYRISRGSSTGWLPDFDGIEWLFVLALPTFGVAMGYFTPLIARLVFG